MSEATPIATDEMVQQLKRHLDNSGASSTIGTAVDALRLLVARIEHDSARVRLMESQGAIFGMMKEAEKEPYLTYDIREGSPLARELEKITELTVELAECQLELARLREPAPKQPIALSEGDSQFVLYAKGHFRNGGQEHDLLRLTAHWLGTDLSYVLIGDALMVLIGVCSRCGLGEKISSPEFQNIIIFGSPLVCIARTHSDRSPCSRAIRELLGMLSCLQIRAGDRDLFTLAPANPSILPLAERKSNAVNPVPAHPVVADSDVRPGQSGTSERVEHPSGSPVTANSGS